MRGYPLAEAAGDNGFFVSAELIVPFPFKVNVLKNPRPVQLDQILSFFAFLDHGAVFIKNRQPSDLNDRDLSGAGLGFRLNVSSLGPNYPAVRFALAYGFPVFGGPDPSDGSSNTLYLNGMVSLLVPVSGHLVDPGGSPLLSCLKSQTNILFLSFYLP